MPQIDQIEMGSPQDIFSLITDSLKYFLQTDSFLNLLQLPQSGESKMKALGVVGLANNLGFNSGPPEERVAGRR